MRRLAFIGKLFTSVGKEVRNILNAALVLLLIIVIAGAIKISVSLYQIAFLPEQAEQPVALVDTKVSAHVVTSPLIEDEKVVIVTPESVTQEKKDVTVLNKAQQNDKNDICDYSQGLLDWGRGHAVVAIKCDEGITLEGKNATFFVSEKRWHESKNKYGVLFLDPTFNGDIIAKGQIGLGSGLVPISLKRL